MKFKVIKIGSKAKLCIGILTSIFMVAIFCVGYWYKAEELGEMINNLKRDIRLEKVATEIGGGGIMRGSRMKMVLGI